MMNELSHTHGIPDIFWTFVGIGIMVFLCSAGRAVIIHEKNKTPEREAGDNGKD